VVILIVTNYFPPYSKGGYEMSCKDMCDYLGLKHKVIVLTGDYQFDHIKSEGIDNYEVNRSLMYIDYIAGGYKQKHNVERVNYELTKKTISDINPDVIYLWNQQGISLAPMFASQESKKPIVFDFGDFWYRLYLQGGIKDRFKRFAKEVLPFTVSGKPKWSNVVAVSQWMAEVLQSELKPEKLQVIGRGVDLKSVNEVSKDDGILKLMYSGRIDREKGLDICIESLRNLSEVNPDLDFEFNIFGDGDKEYLSKCLNLVKQYKLEDRIHYIGRVSNIYQEYAKHHILLMPTLATETFGRVVIEAMAHECIVIATDKYGPSEIIEHGVDGYLIPQGSSTEMTEIVASLHGNIDRMKLVGKNAKLKIENKYNLDRVNELREKVLQEEVINYA